MSRTRPAPLSSNLLAQKGGAAPAIRDKSPFLRSVEASAAPVVAKLPLPEPASVADKTHEPAPALVAEAIGAPAPRASGRRRVALFAAALAVALAAAVAIGVTNRESPAPPPAAPQPEAAAVEPSAAAIEPQPAVPAPAEAAADVSPIAPDVAPAAPATAPAEPPAAVAEPAASAAPLPKAKPPIAPEAPAANGRYAVQFASVRSAEGARREAQRIARKLNATLQGRDLAVVRAETRDQGTRYRVMANGYATLGAARAACAAARDRDEDCLVIRR